ncbi:AAEL009550-PA [Aedes aegypti]|uniref:AAEL009550-PA n=1 Tax=Aedes aegypti TaxID=7159 RepID=Q16VJ5_AEDAE|nr:AAEL009550-PA [Aedes aegypti]
MDWNHLTPEEIDFELLLRNTTGIRGKDRDWKISRLQQLVDRERNGTPAPTYSSHVVSDMDSIYHCQTTLSPIFHALNTAIQQGNKSQITSLRSRLLHYKFRLSLISDSMILENAKKSSVKICSALRQIEESLQDNVVGGQDGKEDLEDLPSDPETLKRLKIAQLQSSINEAGKQQKILEQELEQQQQQHEKIPQQPSHQEKEIPDTHQRQQLHDQNLQKWHQQQFQPQQHLQEPSEQRQLPNRQDQRLQQDEQQGILGSANTKRIRNGSSSTQKRSNTNGGRLE